MSEGQPSPTNPPWHSSSGSGSPWVTPKPAQGTCLAQAALAVAVPPHLPVGHGVDPGEKGTKTGLNLCISNPCILSTAQISVGGPYIRNAMVAMTPQAW